MSGASLSQATQLPRNCWYPVLASGLLKDAPVPTRIAELFLVAYRTDGDVAVLTDRCPHRGTPLSLGRLKNGKIQCIYHGWEFSSDGSCTSIPSLLDHQHPPASCGVRAFDTIEQDGYVWIWLGEQAPAPSMFPFRLDGSKPWIQGGAEWNCNWLRALENAMDPTHATFAHPGLHPQAIMAQHAGLREIAHEVVATAKDVTVYYPPRPDNCPGHEPEVVVRFVLPNVVHLTRPAQGVHLLMHFTPLGKSRCRVEWTSSAPGFPPGFNWKPEEPAILRQDRIIVEGIEERNPESDYALECNVPVDTTGLLLRRLLADQTNTQSPRTGATVRKIIRHKGT